GPSDRLASPTDLVENGGPSVPARSSACAPLAGAWSPAESTSGSGSVGSAISRSDDRAHNVRLQCGGVWSSVVAAEAVATPLQLFLSPKRSRVLSRAFCPGTHSEEHMMHATIRRYEGVDAARTDELTRKVGETLVPRLKSLEGFSGYYLIEADNGVFSSVGLFKEPAQSDEATKIAAAWVKDEKLESMLPNPPRITSGRVIAQS